MRSMGVWVMAAVVTLLFGCENSELVTCRQDKETLLTKVTSLQAELKQAHVALQRKDDQIATIRTDNVDIQEKAMESIMFMLTKEEERRRQLQAAMSEKDAELKAHGEKAAASLARIAELEMQVETLRSQVGQVP